MKAFLKKIFTLIKLFGKLLHEYVCKENKSDDDGKDHK